jgi:hypothetical protein
MISILDVLLFSLVSNLPQIAIAIVGLVLVKTRLKGFHPRAYLYGTAGLALLLANGLLGAATRAYIHANAGNYGDASTLANRVTMANVVSFVVLAVSLVLILVALLADRSTASNSHSAT